MDMRMKLRTLRDLTSQLEVMEDLTTSLRIHICGEVDYLEQKIASLENDVLRNIAILESHTKETQECLHSLSTLGAFLDTVKAVSCI